MTEICYICGKEYEPHDNTWLRMPKGAKRMITYCSKKCAFAIEREDKGPAIQ